MLQLTQSDTQRAGGILSALSAKCAEYVRSIIPVDYLKPRPPLELPDRFIVHMHPHLDEYCAELLFRALLPADARRRPYLEQALYSKDNDSTAKHLWPLSAVFGIGNEASGGARALHLFDEHANRSSGGYASCTAVVASEMLRVMPPPLAVLVEEVNLIDKFGNAHAQHLNNLIKTVHEVHYCLNNGRSSAEDIRDTLSPPWKRAIIDAVIVSFLYCLQEKKDISSQDETSKIVKASIRRYRDCCPFKTEQFFEKAFSIVGSNCLNVGKVFTDAVLKTGTRPDVYVLDSNGVPKPQLMIVPRICNAVYKTWGDELGFLIMAHFWESELVKQMHYDMTESYLHDLVGGKAVKSQPTPFGSFSSMILSNIRFEGSRRLKNGTRQSSTGPVPLWLLGLTQSGDVVQPHKAMISYINEQNFGVGIILSEDTTDLTKAIQRCGNVPDDFWGKLVRTIKEKEKECWHVMDTPNGIPPFILNGSKAHQYMPRSTIDLNMLSRLCLSIQ